MILLKLPSCLAARHVVEEKKDVKRAMEFLKECDLLKIEDILPFFHDFVIIDDFKVSEVFLFLSIFIYSGKRICVHLLCVFLLLRYLTKYSYFNNTVG